MTLESAFRSSAPATSRRRCERVDEALEILRKRGRVAHESVFVKALCWINRSRGRLQRAIEHGREGSGERTSSGMNEWAAWVDATLGWALLDARAADAAVECLERGLRAAETPGAPFSSPAASACSPGRVASRAIDAASRR